MKDQELECYRKHDKDGSTYIIGLNGVYVREEQFITIQVGEGKTKAEAYSNAAKRLRQLAYEADIQEAKEKRDVQHSK